MKTIDDQITVKKELRAKYYQSMESGRKMSILFGLLFMSTIAIDSIAVTINNNENIAELKRVKHSSWTPEKYQKFRENLTNFGSNKTNGLDCTEILPFGEEGK